MTRQQKRLITSYKHYRAAKKGKANVLGFLRSNMAEIIFRTTRLEGERVTRRLVSALFK